jgi:cobalt-precorrin 5A hydrolase
MAGGEAMIAAGVGCRRNAPAADVEAVIATALREAGLEAAAIGVVATLSGKAAEPGIIAAVRRLGCALRECSRFELARATPMTVGKSQRVRRAVGVPSVAEAAALAAAGRNARLLVPRQANATATCALAEGQGVDMLAERRGGA